MAELSHMLLLVNAAVGFLSGVEITSRYVCSGNSLEAFKNIDFDRCNSRVSLNINGKINTEIATWLWQNCTLNASLIKEYTDRVFLDQNGTITIHNLHHFDQGKYVLISKKDALPSIKEVQIHVMVAPSKNCKPMMVRLGNKLVAFLNDGECGNPVATLYWKGDGNVSDTNDAMLKMTPGNESRTYYACIKGPALQCSKSHMPPDNCWPFITEGNTGRTVPAESCSTDGFIVIIIVLGILLTMAIAVIVILILILKRHRNRNFNCEHTADVLDDREHTFDDVNTEQAKILQLCDKDLDNMLPPSNDQQQSLATRSDSDYEMNEIGTDYQSDINPDTIRELRELRDAALCKICFAKKTSVFFKPCNHVATCDKCSIPLQNCPVCRATIQERQIIYFDSN